MFIASSPLNEKVLGHLRGRLKTDVLIAAPDSVRDAYMSQGSHPDIVERVWNKLGKALPGDCRCLVYGTPALVQPASGIILAFCYGTQYCVRLTSSLMDEALKLGLKTSTKWAGGKTTDTTQAFGSDWIFGSWKVEELQWCREVFETYNHIVKEDEGSLPVRFSYYQERMKNASDIGRPGNEWDVVKELILESPPDLKETLSWIFEKHVGYVEPRVIAGQKLFVIDQDLTWQLVERLIMSKDPDDRDVALTFVVGIGDSDKYQLALPLLDDKFAYIALNAAEILWRMYPEKARLVALRFLNDDGQNSRNQAKKLIENINSISK